jgi:hypothetical protein
VQTPSGRIIEPWMAASNPQMRYVESAGVAYYRLVLPLELQADRFDQGGVWHALLRIGKPRSERTSGTRDGTDLSILEGMNKPPVRQQPPRRFQAAADIATARSTELLFTAAGVPAAAAVATQRTLPYSVVVHAYSNVSLQAHLQQSSFEPGSSLALYATLAQSGIPVTSGAQVWAEVTRPDKSTTLLNLAEQSSGEFAAHFATTSAGVYRFRVRARGATPRGEIFTRERTLTAGVWSGGDRNPDPHRGGENEKLCELLNCLTRPDGPITRALEERLRALGLDLAQARKCLGIICSGKDPNKDE